MLVRFQIWVFRSSFWSNTSSLVRCPVFLVWLWTWFNCFNCLHDVKDLELKDLYSDIEFNFVSYLKIALTSV